MTNKENKVYIVRYGEYSDQGISGVFSTKEKAERYCKIHNEIDSYENYWTSEYILDERELSPEVKVVTYYECCINLETDEWYRAGEIYMQDEEKDIFTEPVIIQKFNDVITVRSVASPEHARKVAIEQYQIYTQQKLEEQAMRNE